MYDPAKFSNDAKVRICARSRRICPLSIERCSKVFGMNSFFDQLDGLAV
jgi:hypothetical protein